MVIEPKEKSWGGDYLRFGWGSTATSRATTRSTRSSSIASPGLNRLGGEWVTAAQVGQDTHVSTEFYQPLSRGGTVVRRR
jgi:NTE family protein